MYKKYFGLQANPFNPNPDPRFLFLTAAMREALAGLAYGIKNRKGFLLLTGEVGTGKTTLLNRLLEWLQEEGVATAFIFNSRLNESEFFDFLMADFGIACESREKSHLLMKLNQWLIERYREHGTTVLIVDEAQNLSPQVLEEIRLLTNMETTSEKLLQIVLSGQPELEEKLRGPPVATVAPAHHHPLQDLSSLPRGDADVHCRATANRGLQRHARIFVGGCRRGVPALDRHSPNRKPLMRAFADQRVRGTDSSGPGRDRRGRGPRIRAS